MPACMYIYEEPVGLLVPHCRVGPPASELHRQDTRRAGEVLPRSLTEAGRRRLGYRGVSLPNEHSRHCGEGFRAKVRAAVGDQCDE